MEEKNEENGMRDQYEDIIHLPHPVSKRHPRMPQSDRAAQFSPFAALTGYEAVIAETARLTEKRPELTESRRAELNEELMQIMERQNQHPYVSATWFREDARKAGGAYVTASGRVKKLDCYEKVLILEDGSRIPMEELMELEWMESGGK